MISEYITCTGPERKDRYMVGEWKLQLMIIISAALKISPERETNKYRTSVICQICYTLPHEIQQMKPTFKEVDDSLVVTGLSLPLAQSRTGRYFRKPPWPLLRSCRNIYIKWKDHSRIFLKLTPGDFLPTSSPSPLYSPHLPTFSAAGCQAHK